MDRISVDVGGTTMRAAVVAPNGTLRAVTRRPTATAGGLIRGLTELLALLAVDDPERVVVGLPGRIDYRSGLLEHAPNLPAEWQPHLHEAVLTEALGVPAVVANDADLAAVGEAVFGAGRGHRDVVYLTISTGVGAGVVVDGRVLAGTRSMAEIGHTVIDLRAARSGQPATVEGIAGGVALAAALEHAGLSAENETVTEAAARSSEARALVQRSLEAAAFGAVNLVHLFAADVVVIGGGIGRHDDLVLPLVRQALADFGPKGLIEPVAVVSAELGDDAGLVGGAAWERPLHAS